MDEGGTNPPAISPSIFINQRGGTSNPSVANNLNIDSQNFPLLSSASPAIGLLGGKNVDSQNPNSCWSGEQLFQNNTSSTAAMKLGFEKPRDFDGESRAFFASGDLKPLINNCESFVVGCFVGKKLYFPYVKETLAARWKIRGEFSMSVHGDQAFFFKFEHEEDRAKVLEMGSVYIGSSLFIIRPWSPFIEQQIGAIKSVPIWMNLRDVPFHLWNELGFSRIASLVGKPIMTDSPTALKTRMSYARICVEVDANCNYPATLPFQIDNETFTVRAEYPWKPVPCSHCKSFGHPSAKCKSNPAPQLKTKWILRTSNQANQEVLNSQEGATIRGQMVIHQGTVVDTTSEKLSSGVNEAVELNEKYKGVEQHRGMPTSDGEWAFQKKKKGNKEKEQNLQAPDVQIPICNLNPYAVLDNDTDLMMCIPKTSTPVGGPQGSSSQGIKDARHAETKGNVTGTDSAACNSSIEAAAKPSTTKNGTGVFITAATSDKMQKSPKINPFMVYSDFKEDSRFPINRTKEMEARNACTTSQVMLNKTPVEDVTVEDLDGDSDDLYDEDFEKNLQHMSMEDKISKRKARELHRLKWNAIEGNLNLSNGSPMALGRGQRSQVKKKS